MNHANVFSMISIIIHRMAVGFADSAHRRPAGMAQHRMMTMCEIDNCLQNNVIFNLLAQKPDIIAQASDFSRHFIGEGGGY